MYTELINGYILGSLKDTWTVRISGSGDSGTTYITGVITLAILGVASMRLVGEF